MNPICLQIVFASLIPSRVLVSSPLHVPWVSRYKLTTPNDTLNLTVILPFSVGVSAGQSASLPLYGLSGLLKSALWDTFMWVKN